MTLQTIQQSDLLGRLVLDRNTTEALGRVEQLWLDPMNHQVVGMTCKLGMLQRQPLYIAWAQIHSIGADSVVVEVPVADSRMMPDEVVAIAHQEVWTDKGDRAGNLRDYRLHPPTGNVLEYWFTSNGWRGITDGLYSFLPSTVLRIGRKRLIVEEAVLQAPHQVVPGLSQRVTQIKETLSTDTLPDPQAIAQTVKKTSQQVAEQAKEKWAIAAEHVQETSQTWRTRLQSKWAQAREKLQSPPSTPPPTEPTTEVDDPFDF
ncbi:MAG: photosystem reaction center subunit H [Leptolyngbyaceae cyanobacterium SL_7_1]|nr:photosystem reaction center subunit H [Leptolyngbyaceae cyanobacterium SL_7_1]